MSFNYKKIVIMGCPASGKTTLANKLGKLLHIPVYHLDKIFWVEPKGIKQDVFIEKQEEIMAQDSWIIEGHFWRSKSFDLRLQKADIIIFFDFPKTTIFWQIFKRTIKNYGKIRPEMPEGDHNKDKFKWGFIKYVWNHDVKDVYTKVLPYMDKKEVIILKNRKEVEEFIKKIK